MRVSGRHSEYVRTSDEGEERSFHFCPECGATVFYTLETAPDVTAVPIGAFADPTFPQPWVSVYESRRHPWVAVPAAEEGLQNPHATAGTVEVPGLADANVVVE